MGEALVIRDEILEATAEPKIKVVLLLNHRGESVGGLYPGTLGRARFEKVAITRTKLSEKYFMFLDGVGIYFSDFRKVYI